MHCANQSQTIKAMNALQKILRRRAFDYIDEKVCQNQIQELLLQLEVEHNREYALSSESIIDFYFPRSQIGLEVKAAKKWSKMGVFRQVERYTEQDCISGIVLASGRAQGLPKIINGKPVAVYQFGLSAL